MDWFRMYGEFASDPKVQSMSEAMQRRLMMLLCLRCSNTLVTLQDEEISFALRISNDELAETKALFVRKGFIDEVWEIANWDKRQFVSDSSAVRVARHRAKVKAEAETSAEHDGNVTVTAQNRTDTEQIQNRADKKKRSATPAALSAEEVAFEFPLNDGSIYQFSTKQQDEFQKLYPSVNLDTELRACVGWSLANPARRKTRGGILKHINSWLAEKQDKPGSARGSPAKPEKFDPVAHVNRNRITT